MRFSERLPALYIATASLYSVAGMFVGLYQHLAQDKKPIPLHSHLDSLGWLSLAVVGIVAHLFPWSRQHPLALLQFVLLELGSALMLGGLPLVYLHLTHVPITLGAILIPIGFVIFSFITISGALKQG